MIVDIEANEKLRTIVTELPFDFISQSYSKVPKSRRLNATHYFLMKISNKKVLQQIASNHFTGERTIRKSCYNQEYSPLGSNLKKNNMKNKKRFMHSIKHN